MTISKNILALAGWLLLSFAAGALGGIASSNAGEFYQQLSRPEWAPPSWLFAPVWSILYLMIGIAAWLVWKERGWEKGRTPLLLFIVQLALNALWTWLFFGWRQGSLAFVEIVILWLLILATMLLFWRIRPAAGALLLPYLLWVSFASALTYSIWQRNPQLLN